MPPLRAEIIIGTKEIKLPDVPPGVPASMTDATETGPSVLILSCNQEDNGGIVYRQKPQDTQEILNQAFRLISSEKGSVEAVIGDKETISLPIITRFGKAILKITHY